MGKITIHTNRIWLFIAYSIWAAITTMYLIVAFDNMEGIESSYGDGIWCLVLSIMCLGYVLLTGKIAYPSFVFISVGLLLMQLLGMAYAGTNIFSIVLVRTSMWLIMMIALYKYLLRNPSAYNFFITLVIVELIILSLYIVQRIYYIRNTLMLASGTNEIYHVFSLIPVLFLCGNKKLRTIGLLVAGAMILFSMKMTAIVAFIVGLIAYKLIIGKLENRPFSVKTIILLIAVILVWQCFPLINEHILKELNIDWGSKLLSANDSGGSGRITIWLNTLNAQWQSSLVEWFVGHGYNTVINSVQFSAHNDFLEVLYDFGLIGFTIYLMLYIALIRSIKALAQDNDRRAAVLGMSVTMFFIMSLFSHLIIVPHLMINYGMVWVVCIINRNSPEIKGSEANRYVKSK